MASIRLDPELQEKVRQAAAEKGMTQSEIHRQALTEYFEGDRPEKKTSRYHDIIGIGEGPPDLARRHKEYFTEIMDEKYRRHTD